MPQAAGPVNAMWGVPATTCESSWGHKGHGALLLASGLMVVLGTRCAMETGQCQCRSHVVGRQCDRVEPGFYRINLDHYTYESEDARLHKVRDEGVPGGYMSAAGGSLQGPQGAGTTLPYGPDRPGSFGVPPHNPPLHQGSVVEREPPTDRPASWTGTGFAHMVEGGWLEFHVSDVPFSMEYDVIIRYEPQVSTRW